MENNLRTSHTGTPVKIKNIQSSANPVLQNDANQSSVNNEIIDFLNKSAVSSNVSIPSNIKLDKQNLEFIIDYMVDSFARNYTVAAGILADIFENTFLSRDSIEMLQRKKKEHPDFFSFFRDPIELLSNSQAIPFDILINKDIETTIRISPNIDSNEPATKERYIDYYTSKECKKYILKVFNDVNTKHIRDVKSASDEDKRTSSLVEVYGDGHNNGFYGVGNIFTSLIQTLSFIFNEKKCSPDNFEILTKRVDNFITDIFKELRDNREKQKEAGDYNYTKNNINYNDLLIAIDNSIEFTLGEGALVIAHKYRDLIEDELGDILTSRIKGGLYGFNSYITPVKFEKYPQLVSAVIEKIEKFGPIDELNQMLNVYAGQLIDESKEDPILNKFILENIELATNNISSRYSSTEKFRKYLMLHIFNKDAIVRDKLIFKSAFNFIITNEFNKSIEPLIDTFVSALEEKEANGGIKLGEYVSLSSGLSNLTSDRLGKIKSFVKKLGFSNFYGTNLPSGYYKLLSLGQITRAGQKIKGSKISGPLSRKSIIADIILGLPKISKTTQFDLFYGIEERIKDGTNQFSKDGTPFFIISEEQRELDKGVLKELSVNEIGSFLSRNLSKYYKTTIIHSELIEYIFTICFEEISEKVKRGEGIYSEIFKDDILKVISPSNFFKSGKNANVIYDLIKSFPHNGKNISGTIQAILYLSSNDKLISYQRIIESVSSLTYAKETKEIMELLPLDEYDVPYDAVMGILSAYEGDISIDLKKFLYSSRISTHKMFTHWLITSDLINSSIYGIDPNFSKKLLTDIPYSNYLSKQEADKINKTLNSEIPARLFNNTPVLSTITKFDGFFKTMCKSLDKNILSKEIVRLFIALSIAGQASEKQGGVIKSESSIGKVFNNAGLNMGKYGEKNYDERDVYIGDERYNTYSEEQKNVIKIINSFIEKSELYFGNPEDAYRIIGANEKQFSKNDIKKYNEIVLSVALSINRSVAEKIDRDMVIDSGKSTVNKSTLMISTKSSRFFQNYLIGSILNINTGKFIDDKKIKNLNEFKKSIEKEYKKLSDISKNAIMSSESSGGEKLINMTSIEKEINKFRELKIQEYINLNPQNFN